jgi:2OG-Fe(II) oxygenase superfamily
MSASTSTVRLPDAHAMRATFLRRGFIRVPALTHHSICSRVADSAMTLIRDHGLAIERTGASGDLSYTVVTGEHIRAQNGFLAELYWSDEMIGWIRTLTDSPAVRPSPHLRSAININCLTRAGQQYPWHRDAVPFTALLFLTSAPSSAGGEFLMRTADGESVAVPPTAGDLIVMDGSRCPHAVAPLKIDTVRVTVPMVYRAFDVERPDGLDQYLYGGT